MLKNGELGFNLFFFFHAWNIRSVFDVTKGKSHYGKGGGYNHFSGRDASRAFVSGNFTGTFVNSCQTIHFIRPVNEPNVHELFMNVFGGKFVYVRLFSKRTNTIKKICSFN
ncbi:putative cytochrome b5-like heme/steroid binding domain-containing protein [Helianthus annuus]|nr:putative cytochrome b5-like heme/steroid binding domain-containing protein [Helianthus annuus]